MAQLKPDSVYAGKCKEIVQEYLPLLLKADQDRLRPIVAQFKNDTDYTQFLLTDGEIIWGRFMEDVAATGNKRHFTPLSSDETTDLWKELKVAFEPEKAEVGQPPMPKSDARGTLLLWASLLLISGFLLIFGTYMFIPTFTRWLFEEKINAMEKTQSVKLQRIEEFLRGDAFNEVRDSTSDLAQALRGADLALKNMDDLVNSAQVQASKGKVSLENVQQRIDNATSAETEVRQQLEKLQLVPPATPPPPAAADAATSPTLLEALTSLGKSLQEGKTPDEVVSAANIASGHLKTLQEEVRRVSSSITVGGDGTAEGSMGLVEIKRLLDNAVKGSSDLTSALSSLEKLTDPEDPVAFIEIPTQAANQIRSLSESAANMKSSIDALKSANGELTTSVTAASKALTDLSASASLKTLSERTDVVDTIQSVTQIIDDTRESLSTANERLDDVGSVLDGLAEITDIQSSLAFRGSSPAVLLLFAIGGMFVVFGLSLLLRSVKAAEHESAERQWREHSKLYAHLAASLIAKGIDPTAVLTRLQTVALHGADEAPKANGRLPVSVTLTELIDMLRLKS
jgi:hypothetical protein